MNDGEVMHMANQLELIEAEALKLSIAERASLAQLLLASLEEKSLEEKYEIDDAWDIETQRRITDIERGVTQVIPIADALAQVRTALP